MNKKRKRNTNKYTVLIFLIIFLSVVGLSGCVDNQNKDIENLSKFTGTWTGHLDLPMFNGSNNSTITQLLFVGTSVTACLTGDRGTFTMNYSYSLEENKLVLQPKFNDNGGPSNRQPFNDSMPFNDTRPPINGSWPPNGTIPPNDTWSPNGTRPSNGEQDPFGQRPVMSISFVYSFNEKFNVLYLDDSQFFKIQ